MSLTPLLAISITFDLSCGFQVVLPERDKLYHIENYSSSKTTSMRRHNLAWTDESVTAESMSKL